MKERNHVLRCLNGETIEFPDLRQFLPLKSPTSSHHAALEKELNHYIDRSKLEIHGLLIHSNSASSLFPDKPAYATMVKTIDLSFLCSMWWPKAPWQELSTVAKLAAWFLLVDDNLDQGDVNDEATRHDTCTIQTLIGETLGLYKKQPGRPPRNAMVEGFVDPGQMVRSSYTHGEHVY